MKKFFVLVQKVIVVKNIVNVINLVKSVMICVDV